MKTPAIAALADATGLSCAQVHGVIEVLAQPQHLTEIAEHDQLDDDTPMLIARQAPRYLVVRILERWCPDLASQLEASEVGAYQPCGLLTAEQISKLGLSTPEPDSDAAGVRCGWRFGDGQRAHQPERVVPHRRCQRLANTYRQKAAAYYDCGYFEPTSINGFTAALADSTDRRGQDQIRTLLGLNGRPEIRILIQSPPRTNVKAGTTSHDRPAGAHYAGEQATNGPVLAPIRTSAFARASCSAGTVCGVSADVAGAT